MPRLSTTLLGGAVLAAVLAAPGSVLVAQDSAEGVIKYRQSLMGSQGGHLGAIARVVRGEAPFTDHLLGHAMAIQATSHMILDAFPEGSGDGETRALPAIWEDWEGFTAAAERLQAATADLVAAIESGDPAAVAPAFGPVGQSCGGCHETYRAE